MHASFSDNDPRGIEARQANSLSYRNVAPGKVSIQWTYPSAISGSVVGAVILYSDRKNLPMDQWRRINIPDANMKSVVLHNLHPGSRYHVHIIPRLINGELDYQNTEKFEFLTDNRKFCIGLMGFMFMKF